MVARRQYATSGALRTALETRLLERSRREAVDLHRLRRQVAFDRLLARMFDASQPAHDAWVLKGGYALELRFHRARATKDLDLTVRATSSVQTSAEHQAAALRERLQIAASVQLADFFVFDVGEPGLELNQAPEGGSRFPVDARLDGRTFVKFHIDLGVGDEVIEPLDLVVGEDWLAFAGIRTVAVPTLSTEQIGPRNSTRTRCRETVPRTVASRISSTSCCSSSSNQCRQRESTSPCPPRSHDEEHIQFRLTCLRHRLFGKSRS